MRPGCLLCVGPNTDTDTDTDVDAGTDTDTDTQMRATLEESVKKARAW